MSGEPCYEGMKINLKSSALCVYNNILCVYRKAQWRNCYGLGVFYWHKDGTFVQSEKTEKITTEAYLEI